MKELTTTERMVLAAIAKKQYEDYKPLLSAFKTLERRLLIKLILDEQGNVINANITPKGKKLLTTN